MHLEQFFKKQFQFSMKLCLLKLFFYVNDMTFANAICKPFCNVPSSWITQETNICYEAKGRKPAVVEFKQDCQLYALRLRHISGSLACWNDASAFSRWGCDMPKTFFFLIVDPTVNPARVWCPDVEWATRGNTLTTLDGFDKEDEVIVIKRKSNFTTGDQLQVWYTEDWFTSDTQNNDGRHCIGVDVSCFV